MRARVGTLCTELRKECDLDQCIKFTRSQIIERSVTTLRLREQRVQALEKELAHTESQLSQRQAQLCAQRQRERQRELEKKRSCSMTPPNPWVSAFVQAPVPLVTLSWDGRVQACNMVAAAGVKMTPEEYVGTDSHRFLDPESSKKVVARMDDYLSGRNRAAVWTVETVMFPPGRGPIRIVTLVSVLTGTASRPLGILCMSFPRVDV